MALCRQRCPDCPMSVTVLVDGSACLALMVAGEAIMAEAASDIAVILRVDGEDMAVSCSHTIDQELW